MGIIYSGKVVELHKNHGMVETTIKEHKVRLYFNVMQDMIDREGKSTIQENVSFEIRNVSWHGINIVCAYNLKSKGGQIVQMTSLHIKEKDFSRFLFAQLRPESIPGKRTIDKLMETERSVNMFYLKWILFIENAIKKSIEKGIRLIDKDSTWLINKLRGEQSTKKIIKSALESVKEKTWLLSTSEFVTFSQNENDPNNVCVYNAPINLILSVVTLGELSDILKAIIPDLEEIKKHDEDLYIFLWYAEGMLSDLSMIRNSAAHGNAITPLIIDNTFSPAYFYEMTDAFPQWNSNESLNDAEKYKAFTFIRYLAKGEAKSGISLVGLPIGSPQLEALFFTKSLYLNPARRSFFSFFFLIHVVFSFIDDEQREQFYSELKNSGLSFYKDDANSSFSNYPNIANSITVRLVRIVYLILKYGGKDSFKGFASILRD